MSAAATAAGYLYASGRLRGRNAREQDDGPRDRTATDKSPPREKVRVAVMPQEPEPAQPQEKPKRTPKIEYRRRRLVTPE
jgi:hypothetical protein